jgi:hypothetical protein
MKKLLSAGIRLIKGGATSSKQSYGNIPKGKPISKGGVESALDKANLPKSYGTLKPNVKAFKGVQSAGATRNAPVRAARAARGNKVLAGTAAGLGAAVVYNKDKSSAKAAASPAAVAPKKKPTNVVTPRKAAPKKAEPKSKAKTRSTNSTPTNKKTPLSVSENKKKVGYVKSNRSLRGGSRTRNR